MPQNVYMQKTQVNSSSMEEHSLRLQIYSSYEFDNASYENDIIS